MPCLVGFLALFMPRLAIVLVVVFSDYLVRAYETTLWPLLGFFFMPVTTLAWAWAINENGRLSGIHLVAFIVAILMDLGLLGGSGSGAARRAPRGAAGRRGLTYT